MSTNRENHILHISGKRIFSVLAVLMLAGELAVSILAAPPAVSAFTQNKRSVHISDRHGIQESRYFWSDGSDSLEIRMKGRNTIEFTDDDADIKS
ncbi:MAG: hypothetical protein AB1489_25625, partial [Acidobacteriota bacterium]